MCSCPPLKRRTYTETVRKQNAWKEEDGKERIQKDNGNKIVHLRVLGCSFFNNISTVIKRRKARIMVQVACRGNIKKQKL
jgi:hypothetical protein